MQPIVVSSERLLDEAYLLLGKTLVENRVLLAELGEARSSAIPSDVVEQVFAKPNEPET